MGYSIGWLAVKSSHPGAVHQALHVRPTTEPDDAFERAIAGVTLSTGWVLLVAQASERVIDPRILSSLSTRWPCVACLVEEHVMASSAAYWSDGVEVWSIDHDANKGILHLDATGQLPGFFASVRDEKMREQQLDDAEDEGDVDHIFDVPLLVAKQLTGFKHDDQHDGSLMTSRPVAFTDDAPKKRGWWPW